MSWQGFLFIVLSIINGINVVYHHFKYKQGEGY